MPRVSKKTQEDTIEVSDTLVIEREHTLDTKSAICRDDEGLVASIHHARTPQGYVDWRAMLNAEYVVPNAEYFKKYGKAVPESAEGLKDKEVLILLPALKEVAKLRGYSRVDHKAIITGPEYVSIKTTITWLPNFETDFRFVEFSSLASAHLGNTDSFAQRYLVEIAENRGFCRAVRNFLGIHIVAQDEVSKDQGEDSAVTMTKKFSPQQLLEDKLGEKGITFDKFLVSMQKLGEDTSAWKAFKDVPDEKIFLALNKIAEKEKAEK